MYHIHCMNKNNEHMLYPFELFIKKKSAPIIQCKVKSFSKFHCILLTIYAMKKISRVHTVYAIEGKKIQ